MVNNREPAADKRQRRPQRSGGFARSDVNLGEPLGAQAPAPNASPDPFSSGAKARAATRFDTASMDGAKKRSRSKRGLLARILANASSSIGEDLSGRWNSMPSAAASNSMARIWLTLAFIVPRR